MAKKKMKLSLAEKRLAPEFIAEEVRTGRYPRKQAIAIGISRAKAQAKKIRRSDEISRIMARYR